MQICKVGYRRQEVTSDPGGVSCFRSTSDKGEVHTRCLQSIQGSHSTTRLCYTSFDTSRTANVVVMYRNVTPSQGLLQCRNGYIPQNLMRLELPAVLSEDVGR